MIAVYAILSNDSPLQAYIHSSLSEGLLKSLISHTLRSSKENGSKIIQFFKVSNFNVFYFKQDSFTFLLATTLAGRDKMMQNYLRIVADIFYESYEEGKFGYVLSRVMVCFGNIQEQVNRIEEERKDQVRFEDEESSLVEIASLVQQKSRINGLIKRRHQRSMRAYVISTLLFLGIVLLAVLYLGQRWK